MRRSCFLALIGLLAGCSGKKSEEKGPVLFTAMSPEQTGISFSNQLNFSDSVHIFLDQYLFNGGGVAAGDVNNDGRCDLFFTGNQGGCKLYLNQGDFKFKDATAGSGISTSGWCTGTSMTDVNNDGFLDIYVCRSANQMPVNIKAGQLRNLLFVNKGDGTFTEQSEALGLNGLEYSSHGTFFDMENDGDLDLYVANHPFNWAINMDKPYRREDNYNDTFTNSLWENTGKGFKNITKKAGVSSYSFGLAVSAADLDQDGLQDLYVSNDYEYPDFVWKNKGNGTFEEVCRRWFRHTSFYSMGNDLGDVNNDALPDVVTVDMLPPDNYRKKTQVGPLNWDRYSMRVANGYGEQFMRNTLQINNGNGSFSDMACLAGVAETDWSWSPLLADYDNDGKNDLFISNGYYRDYNDLDYINYKVEQFRKLNMDNYKGFKQGYYLKFANEMPYKKLKNFAFRNKNGLQFEDVSAAWGLDFEGFSNGAAYADLDNDGDLDLVVNNLADPPAVYRNNADAKKDHWLRVQFRGRQSNRLGLGCKVLAETDSGRMYRELTLSHGFQSSSEPLLHFGLGALNKVNKLTVIWPSGLMQELSAVNTNQVLTLDEQQATQRAATNLFALQKALDIQELTAESGLNFKHSERTDFIDFKFEPLIPRRQSMRGPALAAADVNGDTREDVFIGNGAGSSGGVLYLGTATGGFSAKPGPWKAHAASEQTGAVFFDADGDRDMDLYVCSGSNEFPDGSPNYQDHLYLNDGRGSFASGDERIPALRTPKNCVKAADVDGDGDQDLFLGGAVMPDRYPMPARSYLLRNNGGNFSEATAILAPGLENAGIITDAVFADVSNDKKADLILCGEWMPVQVWQHMGGSLKDRSTDLGLNSGGGWWNAVHASDLDGDGDMDLLLGNQGMNSIVRPEATQPASVVAGDFDNNGRLDAVCSYYIQGQSTPWHAYDEMAAQMVGFMRKNYLRYGDYANQTASTMFGTQAGTAYQRLAGNFRSCIVWNDGGTLSITPMPLLAQSGCINGIATVDVNGDGKLDVLLNGNNTANKAEWGNDDAMNGLVLLNLGQRQWKVLRDAESGFRAAGNTRKSVLLNSARGPMVLVARSNEAAGLWRLRKTP